MLRRALASLIRSLRGPPRPVDTPDTRAGYALFLANASREACTNDQQRAGWDAASLDAAREW